MSKNETIRAWKDARFAATLTDAPANPAGTRLVEVSDDQLQNVAGAAWYGRYLTASYECWGFSCAALSDPF